MPANFVTYIKYSLYFFTIQSDISLYLHKTVNIKLTAEFKTEPNLL